MANDFGLCVSVARCAGNTDDDGHAPFTLLYCFLQNTPLYVVARYKRSNPAALAMARSVCAPLLVLLDCYGTVEYCCVAVPLHSSCFLSPMLFRIYNPVCTSINLLFCSTCLRCFPSQLAGSLVDADLGEGTSHALPSPPTVKSSLLDVDSVPSDVYAIGLNFRNYSPAAVPSTTFSVPSYCQCD